MKNPAINSAFSIGDKVSNLLYTQRGLLLGVLLAPPLLWFGIVYLGSLLSLLANSFYRLDDFTGQIIREVGLGNFIEIFSPTNLDVALRSTTMAIAVTIACIAIAFPIAYYMARHAKATNRAKSSKYLLWREAVHGAQIWGT